jgi:hypothetical protein
MELRTTEHSDTPLIISVEPVDGGWRLSCEGLAESLMFLSGGRAEAHARVLADRLAALGHDAVVQIHDRDNNLAGAVRYRAH